MGQYVLDHVEQQHILIGSAAVADYVPSNPHQGKMKKSGQSLALNLTPTLDIMKEVGDLPGRPFTVGFAAETDRVSEYAREKRTKKNMDMIAANRVGTADSGFEVDTNQLDVYWDSGEQHLQLAHKGKIARQLISLISSRYQQQAAV
jgi:phosphopantothenoylcysteine decarboxylase/phosphopantothenate--cysteine ligase